MSVEGVQQVDRLLHRRHRRTQTLQILMNLLQPLHLDVEDFSLRLYNRAQQRLSISDLYRSLHHIKIIQGLPHPDSCRAVRDVRQFRGTQMLHNV